MLQLTLLARAIRGEAKMPRQKGRGAFLLRKIHSSAVFGIGTILAGAKKSQGAIASSVNAMKMKAKLDMSPRMSPLA